MLRMTLLMVLVAGCGSKAPQETTPTALSNEPVATGTAASSDPPGCSDAFDVACGTEGELVDGCDTRDAAGNTLTTEHACVLASTAGPPCTQEVALDCSSAGPKLSVPTQMIDACLLSPPKATIHICVVAPDARIGTGAGTGNRADQ